MWIVCQCWILIHENLFILWVNWIVIAPIRLESGGMGVLRLNSFWCNSIKMSDSSSVRNWKEELELELGHLSVKLKPISTIVRWKVPFLWRFLYFGLKVWMEIHKTLPISTCMIIYQNVFFSLHFNLLTVRIAGFAFSCDDCA